MRAAAVIAAAALLTAAFVVVRRQAAGVAHDEELNFDVVEEMGFPEVVSTLKNIVTDVSDSVGHPNVRAFRSMIRVGEGTAGQDGYRTLFGGSMFSSFADHPRVRFYEKKDEFIRNGKKDYTTAAGAYQITETTWGPIATKYGLADFSPESQDIAATALIKRRGALADVIAGRFEEAIRKCASEWASLPGSPWGQPTITMARALDVLRNSGAVFA